MTVSAKTMNQNPDLAFAYSIQGVVRAELIDDRQGAIDSYDLAIQLQPERALTYYFRAKTRYKLGDKQGAIDDFDRSIQLNPDYINAYTSRGVVRSSLGDRQSAIDNYTKASELFKTQGKIKESKDMLDRVKELNR
jgi:tetratricopeptide (TPR) repeat protein